jgi:SRSO17 transposase
VQQRSLGLCHGGVALLGRRLNILWWDSSGRTTHPGPSPEEKRLAAYLEGLAKATGHSDRQEPLKDCCRGLLLPGQRKSVEPMAARLHPDRVQAARQSLHHPVAKAPWSDEAVRPAVRVQLPPAMTCRQPIVAWIVHDTGVPEKGRHSVGVARQYCGPSGKWENGQVAVATW